MKIDAKINLRINGVTSFWNKRYAVYLNDNFVGSVDYKNSKIGLWSTVGTHKIVVKRKDFEKRLELNLTTDKNIVTVNINENVHTNYLKNERSSLLKGAVIGASIIFFLLTLYFFIFGKAALKSTLILPIILCTGLLFSINKKKVPFDLKLKNTLRE